MEFLNYVGSEIGDIITISLKRISEISFTICSLVDVVYEDFVASKEGLKFVGVGIFVHTYAGRDKVFGLEGTISHHRENINYIMRKAMCVVVTIFTVVIHFELSSRHLSYPVVHSLTCVDGRLQVGIFQRKHSSTSLSCFVSRTNIHKDSNVNIRGDSD